MNAIDFHFDLTQTYTFWSGLLGGLFLMLSYFGCDQSQVQRYLTAKSVDQARHSLMMSAFVKIPLQALVLLTGVLMFVFYLFNQPPMLFNPEHAAKVERARARASTSARDGVHAGVRAAPAAATTLATRRGAGARRRARPVPAPRPSRCRRSAAARRCSSRTSRRRQLRRLTGDTPTPDVNYVFPTFVTTRLPLGLVGLIIAAIFAAAMSAIAGELNALATATVIDFYKRP